MSKLRQAARFAVVGGTATATHLCVGLLLAETVGLEPLWANLWAFAAAVLMPQPVSSTKTVQPLGLDDPLSAGYGALRSSAG